MPEKKPESQTTRTFHKFLNLPPEIRDRIYQFYLVDPNGLLLDISPGTAHAAGLSREMTNWLNSNRHRVLLKRYIALSLASRQIRAEAEEVFWSQNRFLFSSTAAIVRFTDRCPRRLAAMITSVDSKEYKLFHVSYYHAKLLKQLGDILKTEFPRLRRFYMNFWGYCGEQTGMKKLLEEYLGLWNGVQVVVELTHCHCCVRDSGLNERREWWVWKKEVGRKEWDVTVRSGSEEIERVGGEMRGRLLPPEWALGRLIGGMA
jgi:hypothetical protein